MNNVMTEIINHEMAVLLPVYQKYVVIDLLILIDQIILFELLMMSNVMIAIL